MCDDRRCLFSEYVRKYASEAALREHEQSSSESEMSELSEDDEAQDMEL